MKKKYLTVAIVLAISSSMMFTSCIGSFALTNNVLSWNKQVGNKFVNTLIFTAFWIVPVYELSILADALVINSIEFWSGSNPVTAETKIIDGKDAKYQIERDQYGYTITNLADNSVTKFIFDANDNSWSLNTGNETYKLLQFVDDTHVKMVAPGNEFKTIELSNDGILAYQEIAHQSTFALAK